MRYHLLSFLSFIDDCVDMIPPKIRTIVSWTISVALHFLLILDSIQSYRKDGNVFSFSILMTVALILIKVFEITKTVKSKKRKLIVEVMET